MSTLISIPAWLLITLTLGTLLALGLLSAIWTGMLVIV